MPFFATNEIRHPQRSSALRTSSPISIFSRGLRHYQVAKYLLWMDVEFGCCSRGTNLRCFCRFTPPGERENNRGSKKVQASARKVRDIAQNLSTELSSPDRPTDCTAHNSNNELDFLTLFQVSWTLSFLLNMLCMHLQLPIQ